MGRRATDPVSQRAFDEIQLRALSLRDHHRLAWPDVAEECEVPLSTVQRWGADIRRDDAEAHGEA